MLGTSGNSLAWKCVRWVAVAEGARELAGHCGRGVDSVEVGGQEQSGQCLASGAFVVQCACQCAGQ